MKILKTGDTETLDKLWNMRLAIYVEHLRLSVQVKKGKHSAQAQVRPGVSNFDYENLPGRHCGCLLQSFSIQAESSMGCLVDPCEDDDVVIHNDSPVLSIWLEAEVTDLVVLHDITVNVSSNVINVETSFSIYSSRTWSAMGRSFLCGENGSGGGQVSRAGYWGEIGRLVSDGSPLIFGTILVGGPRKFGIPPSNSGLLFQFLSPVPPPLVLFSLPLWALILSSCSLIRLESFSSITLKYSSRTQFPDSKIFQQYLSHEVPDYHIIDCPIHPSPFSQDGQGFRDDLLSDDLWVSVFRSICMPGTMPLQLLQPHSP